MAARKSTRNAYDRFVCLPLAYAGAGYFCSYVIGLLLTLLCRIPALSILSSVAGVLGVDSLLVGAVIGAAVALAFTQSPLSILSAAVAGAIGYSFAGLFTAFLAAYACALFANFIIGKTRADIILIPIVCTAGGILIALALATPLEHLYALCGRAFLWTESLPKLLQYTCAAVIAAFFSVTPLSMFAICAVLSYGSLSGAAFIGCCAAMVSFAAAGYRDFGMFVSFAHAIGTPRLQMGNVFRNPMTLLCPLLSAALGGLCAGLFDFTCSAECIPQALTMFGGVITLLAGTSADSWLYLIMQVMVCAVAVPLAVTIPLNRMLRILPPMHGSPYALEI